MRLKDTIQISLFDYLKIIVWLSLVFVIILGCKKRDRTLQTPSSRLSLRFIMMMMSFLIIAAIMLIIDFYRGSVCSFQCFRGISLSGMFHSFLSSENDYIIKSQNAQISKQYSKHYPLAQVNFDGIIYFSLRIIFCTVLPCHINY